jgi:hypothetical protein
LASPFKSKRRLEAENAALRHQLIVLQRQVRGRVRLTNSDRWFFVQLYRWFPSILQVLTIIQPETLNEPLAAQPTSFASGNSALIAEYVQSGTGCDFNYSTVGPQLGLLTMRISLRRQLFGGTTETISLYHAVHVNNAP